MKNIGLLPVLVEPTRELYRYRVKTIADWEFSALVYNKHDSELPRITGDHWGPPWWSPRIYSWTGATLQGFTWLYAGL